MKKYRGRGVSTWSIAALVLLLGLCLLAPASAFASRTHVFKRSFGAPGSGDGQLELLAPVFQFEGEAVAGSNLAINETSGDVYVTDTGNHRVDQFSESGTFIRAFGADVGGTGVNVCVSGCVAGTPGSAPGSFEAATLIAVDNDPLSPSFEDVYVADTAANLITKFEADGTLVSSWRAGGQLDGSNATSPIAGPFSEIVGIAVDPAGNLDVLENGQHALFSFAEDGSFITDFETPRGSAPGGLGVDPAGNFFKLNAAPSVEKFEGHEPPNDIGQVSESEPSTGGLTVDSSNGDVYRDTGTSIERFAFGPSGEVLGTGCTPAEEAGCPPTETFGPGHLSSGAGLAIDGASISKALYAADAAADEIAVFEEVTLPDATTEAASVLNGTVTFHGAVSAGGGPPATCVFQYVEVEAKDFEGASSVPCSPAGPFTGTAPNSVSAEVSGLPEGAYRFRLLASNEEGSTEGGELFFNTFETVPGLPDGRAYEMVSPAQKGGEVVPPEPSTLLGGSCGDCLPGQNTPVMPMQSAADGESVLYLGEPFFGGLAAAPNDYLASRAADGWGTEGLSSAATTGEYLAFSADLSRGVLLQIEPAFSPEAPTRGGKSFENLYLREGGALQPLVTEEPPSRSPREPGQFRIRFADANAGTALEPAFEHLVFEANDALTEEVPGIAPPAPEVEASGNCTLPGVKCNLYEWIGGQLRLVNVLPDNAEAASNAVIGAGRLLNPSQSPDVDHAISDDGSRIFWTAQETGQLYVRVDGKETLEVPGPGTCKESVEIEERACFLTASADGSKVLLSDGEMLELNEEGDEYEPSADLTLDGGEVHQGGFKGILGAAEDLSRVYFVDVAALTEENANGEHAEAGNLNLYAWNEGELTFIGALLPGDGAFGLSIYGDWTPSPSHRTAQVSPDGRFLAFMSLEPLTGYDNGHLGEGGSSCGSETKPHPGVPCFEVFEYDAVSKSLTCASCNPTGQQPLGPANLSLIRPEGGGPPFRQPANLSSEGGGRLFFESQDVLASPDTNGHIQDIYEWEPNGVGSCKRASGCVYLISSGHSPNDSKFLDSSANGNDAFFITRQQLLSQDKNEQLDLYDARVGGGLPEPGSSPCAGEGCAAPASNPPTQITPGSSGFVGPGNPPRHKHKKKHRRHHHKRAAKHHRGRSK